MTATTTHRWLFTLLALLAPATFGAARACVVRGETPAHQQGPSEVVFRHYL